MDFQRTLKQHLALEVGWVGLSGEPVTAYRVALQAGSELLAAEGLDGLREWLQAGLGSKAEVLDLAYLDAGDFKGYLVATNSGEALGLLALVACWRAAEAGQGSEAQRNLSGLLLACAERLGDIATTP